MNLGRFLHRKKETHRPTPSQSVSTFVPTVADDSNNKQASRLTTREDKNRLLVRQLLSFTLSEDKEKELLDCVAKGFDLPLVIGEQFICKTKPFQSPRNMCIGGDRYSLLALREEPWSMLMWRKLVSELSAAQKCELYKICADLQDRRFIIAEYKQCFVGRECMEWLIKYRMVKDFNEGISCCVSLVREWITTGLVAHAVRNHNVYKDDNFYVFKEPNSRAGMSVDFFSSSKKNEHGRYGSATNISTYQTPKFATPHSKHRPLHNSLLNLAFISTNGDNNNNNAKNPNMLLMSPSLEEDEAEHNEEEEEHSEHQDEKGKEFDDDDVELLTEEKSSNPNKLKEDKNRQRAESHSKSKSLKNQKKAVRFGSKNSITGEIKQTVKA
ncbi:hypothetical protein RFI_18010 [Reticulomyxa filosa]|uniref:DEP domain-containing protein n=1 Tax=Reticulomyxa filosa TaxID=46433 RepID=X6MYV4_RETFI|nr:hypothetical protein RFI_18010 [Reticulomyxa filosa]|eukprot:ETO19225.1 hypothetical protein RFI_18010 [Reticulomyxa filosa]